MESDEKSIWDVKTGFAFRAWTHCLLRVVCVILLLFLAFHPNSPVADKVGFLFKVVAIVAAFFLFLFAMGRFISTQRARYLLTNRRIFYFDREGKVAWPSGFELDLHRDLREGPRSLLATLWLPTLQSDHGHPEWFPIESVSRSDLADFRAAFARLRVEYRTRRNSETLKVSQEDASATSHG